MPAPDPERSRRTIAKGPHASQPTWTSVQAYVLAGFCLLLGVALGYLFRGSASPAGPSASASAASVSQGMSGGAPNQMSAAPKQQTLERAAQQLLSQLKNNPNDFDTIVQLGNLYYDGQQYPDAIQYYDQALKLHPENSDVRTDLGTAYWYLGDADRALREFHKALQYKPDHPGTLFNMGVVKWQGKMDPEGAIAVWEELLKKNPNYPQKQQVLDFIEKAKQHAKG